MYTTEKSQFLYDTGNICCLHFLPLCKTALYIHGIMTVCQNVFLHIHFRLDLVHMDANLCNYSLF